MRRYCDSCGAALQAGEKTCPYCGTLVLIADLDREQIKQIGQFLQSLDYNFHPSTDRAGNQSVVLWILGSALAIVAGVVLVALDRWSVLQGVALGAVGVFVFFWLAVATGEFWMPEWYNRRTYERTVRPLIDAYLAEKHLTRVQLLFAANKTLPKDGRLRRYLFEDLAGELAED